MKCILLLFSLFLIFSCSRENPSIDLVCEFNKNATYIIKWEYAYGNDGYVEIFASDNPDKISKRNPIGKYEINKGYAEINMKKVNRRNFFLLSFNNKYDYKVGTHFINFDSIQNCRDIGGYESNNGKRVKWAKIYRSGSLEHATYHDVVKMKSMHPKTCVDLRTIYDDNYLQNNNLDIFKNIYPISFDAKCGTPINKIYEEKFRTGDAVIYLQDIQLGLAEDGKEKLRSLFDILLEEKNYPIVIFDRHGMHQLNFAVAMVLSALEIPVETIHKDAMLSNKYFDKNRFKDLLSGYSEHIQCVATTLLSVEERYLNSAFLHLRKKYGSIDNYLTMEIGLTREEKEKLRILLLE